MGPCDLACADRREDVVEHVVLGDVRIAPLGLGIAQVDGLVLEHFGNGMREASFALE